MVIRRLIRLFGRRVAAPKAASGGLITWESELRTIAAESAAWSVETGGDLFGRWQASPTVFLATKAGPKAQRNNAHFRLDVDYLRQLSEPLTSNWALRYFGDWHSHHRLGLSAPSSGDRKRIRQVAARNQFPGMVEIIVTTEGSQKQPTIRVHPWLYDTSAENAEPLSLNVRVLAGTSPIRQALIARQDFPEQDLRAWETMPLDRIRIGEDKNPPTLDTAADVDTITMDKALQRADRRPHIAIARRDRLIDGSPSASCAFGCEPEPG